DMNRAFIFLKRRECLPAGSVPASLPASVSEANARFVCRAMVSLWGGGSNPDFFEHWRGAHYSAG
ncbi:MAG: hypothetical protein V3T12_02410, partial [Acidiferrobacterales bacterium]